MPKRQSRQEMWCRNVVCNRASVYCERCGAHIAVRGLTMHHRVKASQGGPWTPQNIVRLCGHGTTPDGCHCWVEHNPNDAEVEGFHVRPWVDPATVPILRRGVRVLLDDAGDWVEVEDAA